VTVGQNGLQTARAFARHLSDAREQRRTVAGYGAPSKAPVLVSLAGVDDDLLPYSRWQCSRSGSPPRWAAGPATRPAGELESGCPATGNLVLPATDPPCCRELLTKVDGGLGYSSHFPHHDTFQPQGHRRNCPPPADRPARHPLRRVIGGRSQRAISTLFALKPSA
jgi:hypothetical protein